MRKFFITKAQKKMEYLKTSYNAEGLRALLIDKKKRVAQLHREAILILKKLVLHQLLKTLSTL